MFSIEQIKQAHSKVKSGADFPKFIQDLRELGVITYESFVTDGHTDYFGSNDYKTSSEANYDALLIADISDAGEFKKDLKAHQQGKTSYLTFFNDCARAGIAKWTVSLETMTCTYYNKAGNEMLVEQIPQ
ncbi:MAG: DUF1398 domain-containing protein [Candidatus Saccharimonadaceae bacterium]